MNSKLPPKKTILAVDDKIENLKILIKYLEDSGFELMVAQSGEEAFKHIKRIVPDMILLDVLMPGIDGFETCQQLKQNKSTKDIPVIFMTALTDTLDKVRGFEVGAVDYLTKPLQHEEVLARVNAHMNTLEFQQQLKEKNILLQQKIMVFNNLMQMDAYSGPLINESTAMQRLQRQIDSVSRKVNPIFITGESGTGKVFLAKKIHESVGDVYTPLIVVDCMRVEENEASKFLFGKAEIDSFENQSANFGAIHLAEHGTLILSHIEYLDIKSQRILSQYLEESEKKQINLQIHLSVTSSEDITLLAESGRFLPKLANQLSKNVLKVPNMLQRKRDILPLTKLFLDERKKRNGKGGYLLSKSAEHDLLSGQYRHENARELREAVETAALFAGEQDIVAEHIFTGPKSEGTPTDYKISQNKLIQLLLHSKSFIPVLKTLVSIIFFSIILICLIMYDSIGGQIANGMVWGIWEPMLVFFFLFIGRIWCTVCPLSSTGLLAKFIWPLNIDPPQWFRKYSGWLIVALFVLIVWSEQVFHMTANPFATGIFLLTLMTIALFLSWIYKRETWCRYLCPLGNLGATYAVASSVYVRANPGVCATQCNTHECFKGSPKYRECPIFHHPLYTRDAHFCKMCLSCLKSCPHHSANLYLRAPFQSIWIQSDLSSTLNPLAIIGFFIVTVILAARSTDMIDNPIHFSVALILSVAIGIVFYITLPKLLFKKHFSDPAIVSRVAFSIFLLAWGPFMAYHLKEVPGLASLQIQVLENSIWTVLFPITEISLLLISQISIILLSAIFATIVFYKIWKIYKPGNIKHIPWGWKFLFGLCFLYIVSSIFLVLY